MNNKKKLLTKNSLVTNSVDYITFIAANKNGEIY